MTDSQPVSHLVTDTQVPSGTVTFLFTDIEGSTRLLERLREQYATLLEEHHRIIRKALSNWNGREIDTQGDSFFAAFPRATDAIQCVTEIQSVLAEHAWPQGVEIRVRMGLHTGEPIIARTGYVGMDVHRAARIAHAGHGGQVLLSQTTRELVYQDLPPGSKLRYLGAHLLKDLRYPQEIYQLDIPGLPCDFPPLSSLDKLEEGEEPPAPGEPPYKGLQYFDEGDAEWFFGRQGITTRLCEALQSRRFLAVIGASGSGKSSVVRAGLVPALRSQPRTDWQVQIISPAAHPLEALAVSLTRGTESVTATATLIDDLQNDTRSLHLFCQKSLSSRREMRLLLVTDQFEELFTLCRSEAERQAFIDNLLYAAKIEGGPITALITLRADFYERLAQYAELRELVSSNQVYIGAMNASELRAAIEEPARHGGWEFSPGLVELMLHDIGAGEGSQPEPGALPLLSHALLETWMRRRGTLMSLRAYTEAGGVRGAIAHTAESVYNLELTPSQQQIARDIFLRLTELGEGTQDTRRRISIHELIPPGPAGETEQIQAVLVKLADARLITTGEGTVEVAHEALIREWPALREWLAQDREGLRLHRHLTEAAQEWELLERDPGALYRGAHLAQALEWALANPRQLNAQEQSYLKASREAAEWEQAEREAARQRELEAARKLVETERQRAEEQAKASARLRRRAIYLALALVVALGLAAAALLFFSQASKNADLAASREMAAAALNNLNVDPELSALLSLEALDRAYTREAESALHASLPALHLLSTFPLEQVIETLALSPDGKILAAGEGLNGASIILLDSGTGELLREIPTAQRVIFGMAFGPDGKRLASVDWDGDCKIWDVATGKQLLAFHTHDGGASRVGYSPDGTRLVTGGDDATAKIWDSATGELLLTLTGHEPAERTGSLHPGGVIEVAYTSDGRRLVTGGADGTARVWDATTGEVLRVLSGHTNTVYIGLSPDGTRLATAGVDGLVKIWDISPGSQVDQPLVQINHEQSARSLAFSPDGTRFAVASQDGAARVWDANTGVRQLVLVGHAGNIDDLVFSADGARLYTGSSDKTVKTWDLAPGREIFTFPGGIPFYNPDGMKLAYAYQGGIRLRDAPSGEVLADLPIAEQPFIIHATYSKDGKRIATASWDGTASVWDSANGEELATLSGHSDRVWKVAFSPDGTRVASVSDDKTARVWDAASGVELLKLSGHTDAIQGVDFSPDGSKIATSSWDNTIRLWDAATGKELSVIQGETELNDVDFNPDGIHLAASSNEGAVFVWDISKDQAELLYKLIGHTAAVVRLAFSPDGKYLATPSFDGTLKVWRMDTGEEWLTLKAGTAYLTDITFSPDGQRLATGGSEDLVRIFGLDLQDTIELAQSRLTRSLTVEECRKYLHLEQCPVTP